MTPTPTQAAVSTVQPSVVVDSGLSTAALASAIGYNTQSIHARLCRKGDFYGIRPKKLPNGRLVWPANTVDRLLGEKEEA
ncbi:monooxygenase [Guyparkeria sp. SCN-R1]|uniref:monooxygenase n=1 Tax=Guyparkeria sp. SCN-R1 TaxID=2341113 RepID=UPI0018652028|nr:monooxygenase [Guyparkeria sp. SCN-R1]